MPKTNHPRICHTEWEGHKETIKRLYLLEDKSLLGDGGVIELMKRNGFSASKPQYESQFMRWGFKKKLTRETWHTIGRIIKDRDEAGLVSRVYANGTSLSDEKVKKETSRYRICDANGECCIKKELPIGVEVRSDQEAEETLFSSEAQVIHLNNSQTTNPPSNLHASDDCWNLTSDSSCFQINSPNDRYNRMLTDLPSPIIYGDTSSYLPFSDMFPLFVSSHQSPFSQSDGGTRTFFPDIQGFRDTCSVPRNTISLFKNLNIPLFREFRTIWKNTRPETLASIKQAKYLLSSEPDLELQRASVDIVILKQILYLLMNNFAGSDYAVFDTIFEQVRHFSVAHMEDMLNALPHPYAAALQQSILTIAIKSNIPALVSVLIQKGLKINRVACRFRGFRYTPLGLACDFHRLEVVKILLRAGADPDSDHNLIDILLHSLYGHNTSEESFPPVVGEILRELLDARAKVDWSVLENPRFWKGETLIDVYIHHNKLPVVLRRTPGNSDINRMPEAIELCPAGKVTTVFQSALQGLTFEEVPKSMKEFLQSILGVASYQGNLSLVNYFLEFGLTPSPDCLCQAVYGNNLVLVNMYTQMGLEISQLLRHTFKRKGPVKRFPSAVDSDLLEGRPFRNEITTPFAEAIRYDRQEIVSLFKNRVIANAATDPEQAHIAIFAASEMGNVDIIREFLVMNKDALFFSYEPSVELLAAAVFGGNDEIVELLMVAGYQPNPVSIAAAILTRNARLVQLFLDSAAFEGRMSLAYLAVRWGDRDVLRLLIDAGVGVHGKISDMYPLQLPSLAEKDGMFISPLKEAIYQGNHGVVQLLLENGADINDSSVDYDSPLANAIECGHEALAHYLLDRGADPNDPGALQAAAKKSHELTRAILVSFFQRYPNGNTGFAIPALREAIREKNEKMVNMLARHANLNRATDFQNKYRSRCLPSLLGEGIATGSITIVQTLLKSGGDPDSTVEFVKPYSRQSRLNAILKAISTGSLGMVKLLHSAGADLSFSATLGITHTSLQLAVELGHFEIVEYLLNQGVDVNAPPCIWKGGTALQYAAKTGSIYIAEKLLECGAQLNASGSKYLGETAFQFAAEHGRMDMLLLLFHRGVDIVSDGGEQIRRAQELAEKNGQIAAKDLVKQLGAEAQQRAFSTFGNNLLQGLMD